MKLENKELRKPSEIILKNGRTLDEVLELHNMWLNNEEGGEKANLSTEDLSYANLSEADLSYATLSYTDLNHAYLYKSNLSEANLSEANLSGAYLRYANLYITDLTHVDLSEVNLRYSNLRYANLSEADLRYVDLTETNLTNTKFYLTNLYKSKGDLVGVEKIGSRKDTTHYFYKDDRVICGCFGGTMEEFEKKVKESYNKYDKEYKEYMIAIDTLKRLAELHMNN